MKLEVPAAVLHLDGALGLDQPIERATGVSAQIGDLRKQQQIFRLWILCEPPRDR